MSRLALSFPGTSRPELPIDPQGFDAVVRLTDQRHRISGYRVWSAGDAQGQGAIVFSGAYALTSDSLDVLMQQLAGAGFRQVRVDLTALEPPGDVEADDEDGEVVTATA